MYKSIVLSEIKYLLKNKTLIISAVISVFFLFLQLGTMTDSLNMRESNHAPKSLYELQESLSAELAFNCDDNKFLKGKLGINSIVKLDDKKLEEIQKILVKLYGLDYITIEEAVHRQYNYFAQQKILDRYRLDDIQWIEIPAEEFVELMKEADGVIGGGSVYKVSNVNNKISKLLNPLEEKLAYKNFIENDKVTNAFARLFCDYIGIIISLLPIFSTVDLFLRDERNNMNQIIYSKKVSSITMIFSRFSAIIICFYVMVIILSIVPSIISIKKVFELGVKGEFFAFLKYITLWILPIIIFVSAISSFFTLVFKSYLPVFILTICWFLVIFILPTDIGGSVGKSLVPRMNTLYSYSIFKELYYEFLWNRLFYSILGLFLVLLSCLIYYFRRRGGFIGTNKRNSYY